MEEKNNENLKPSYKMVNFLKKDKSRAGIGRSVIVPFLSGITGTCLVIGLAFGVPSINKKLLSLTQNVSTETSTSTLPTVSTSSKMSLTNYTDVGSYAANKILPSVVGITVTFPVNSMFGQSTATATGSGIILSKDGYIVTNNHVVSSTSNASSTNNLYSVENASKITVNLYQDNNTYEAKIIGTDSVTDLAVIKIDKTDLTPAEIGNSNDLKIGEFALVAGNPLGFDFSVTSGSISALNREVTDDEGNKYNVIQTDAAINSGNSGGALVNSEGKVVGITFMKISSTSVEGICFAIPITPSLDVINQLIEYNKVKRPYIGITGTDIDSDTAKRYNLVQGVYIQEIDPLSNATSAGIKAKDIIISIDDKEIKTMDELNTYKYSKKIGDTIKIKVNRDGKELEFNVQLTEQP